MLNVFDTGHPWIKEIEQLKLLRDFPARILRRQKPPTDGHFFFIPNQFPAKKLACDKVDAEDLYAYSADRKFVQDLTQIRVYEDKIAQMELWGPWMPATSVAVSWLSALRMLENAEFPVISKSSVGSASLNVRLLPDKESGYDELVRAFGEGLAIRQGPGPNALQRGYVLWQKFVPLEVTWRVTIIGSKSHVYKRFNYSDRPMAAPSCVVSTQSAEMSVEVESLLEFSARFFAHAKTKWCAIDVLKTPDGRWSLLESSLAWARGNDAAGNAKFFGSSRSLMSQFELLNDELEAGVFG